MSIDPLKGECLDYKALGLISGIEIHQQLNSKAKLFCGCPTLTREVEEANLEFFRYLRPARSELGEIDRAALEESLVSRRFIYKSYDTTCLVEADEEPPGELNREALEISLTIARLLNMLIVDEVQMMRKTVIDGSNTSGFQRTAYVASNGHVETSCGPVGITILCLEEEAARIVEDRGDEVVYSLDRLGIPLVEIGTAPDIVSPQHAREVAQLLGMILRSTGKVKRGLGTIRQDVNVSIAGGARVEVKGVQELNLIEKIVEQEAERQVRLLKIREELMRRKASVPGTVHDVTVLMSASSSRVIESSIRNGGAVLATVLRGFCGLVGQEIQPGRRLGTELSDRARRAGVGGIFHTDELPAYGITAEEVEALSRALNAEDEDCLIMVTGPRERAGKALLAAIERAEEALSGVPEETRRALPDGNSEYMRPLPGSARMYPETDVPPVEITAEMLDGIVLPELFTERALRFEREHGLNSELSRLIASSPNYQLFEEALERFKLPPALVVRTLEVTPIELARNDVDISSLDEARYMDCLALLASGRIAKEGLSQVLAAMAKNPHMSASEAAMKVGMVGMDDESVESLIRGIVQERAELVRERGERALGPLMGIAMKELRGKADGAMISSILKREMERLRPP
ncbi:MAG: Glu-tRNA(Gln) amidotransferase subunit GatE [Methanotrichaceae archaeon]|nr:Glu-tRNA(Gln) amidotransferase subunit GatE [Methanotrichaceae archaeon]